jgi:hypothetical protein
MLGHQSIETTVSSYIHSFHFIQREQLAEHLSKSMPNFFTTKGLANLLGVTPRRVRQILVENQATFIKEGRKRYYCIGSVLDLLSGYS